MYEGSAIILGFEWVTDFKDFSFLTAMFLGALSEHGSALDCCMGDGFEAREKHEEMSFLVSGLRSI